MRHCRTMNNYIRLKFLYHTQYIFRVGDVHRSVGRRSHILDSVRPAGGRQELVLSKSGCGVANFLTKEAVGAGVENFHGLEFG